MAEFKPVRTTSNHLNITDIPLEDGKIIFVLDTNEIYVDKVNNGVVTRTKQLSSVKGTSSSVPEWFNAIGEGMMNNGYLPYWDNENGYYKFAPVIATGYAGNILRGLLSTLSIKLGYILSYDNQEQQWVISENPGGIMNGELEKLLQEQYNMNWKASTVEYPVTYKVGSLVIHEENNDIGIYRCNTQNSDTVWTLAHWDLITVLQSDITAIENTLDAMNDAIEDALAGHFT